MANLSADQMRKIYINHKDGDSVEALAHRYKCSVLKIENIVELKTTSAQKAISAIVRPKKTSPDKILAQLSAKGSTSANDLKVALGMPLGTVKKTLERLEKDGKVVKNGNKYAIAKRNTLTNPSDILAQMAKFFGPKKAPAVSGLGQSEHERKQSAK